MPAKDRVRRREWQRLYNAQRRQGMTGHVTGLPPVPRGRPPSKVPACRALSSWMAAQRVRIAEQLDAMERNLAEWRETEPDASRDKLIRECGMETRDGNGTHLAAPALK